jgi:hypothetical protein
MSRNFRAGDRVGMRFWEGRTVERFGSVQGDPGGRYILVRWDHYKSDLMVPRMAVYRESCALPLKGVRK